MKKYNAHASGNPEETTVQVAIEEVLRDGARKMLQNAIECEVDDYLHRYSPEKDGKGLRLAVRNGYMPERELITGIGGIRVKQPRVDDRKLKKAKGTNGFSSRILPRYMRRIPSIDNLIPALYLKGVSTGDFPTALAAILGEGAKGLSASTIVRLKQIWEEDYKRWAKRSIEGKEYVYFWVDGVYFNVRFENERTCILVIIGADREGNKELVAINDGYRESKIGWKEMLLDLKRRGLEIDPRLAVGDGALGFWAALEEICPQTGEQRCWVHKTANILDKIPKRIQPKAKTMIHDMYMADSKETAISAYEHFIETFKDKYPRAVDCLRKDKEQLFTFYNFPAAHWIHIRTTNPIESTFATVKHRTKRTKGCGTRMATLSMCFKLAVEAQKTWKKLRGYKIIPLVMEDHIFVDGVLKEVA